MIINMPMIIIAIIIIATHYRFRHSCFAIMWWWPAMPNRTKPIWSTKTKSNQQASAFLTERCIYYFHPNMQQLTRMYACILRLRFIWNKKENPWKCGMMDTSSIAPDKFRTASRKRNALSHLAPQVTSWTINRGHGFYGGKEWHLRLIPLATLKTSDGCNSIKFAIEIICAFALPNGIHTALVCVVCSPRMVTHTPPHTHPYMYG